MCERIDLTPAFDPISGVVKEHLIRYVRTIGDVFNKDILDVACGTGYGSELLSHFARSITGIDCSQDAITATKARHFHCPVEIIQLDLNTESIPNKYDTLISFETIEHLKDPADFVAKLKACAKPGAILYLSTPNNEGRPNHNAFHLHEFTVEKIRNMVGGSWFGQDEYGISGDLNKPYLFGRIVL